MSLPEGLEEQYMDWLAASTDPMVLRDVLMVVRLWWKDAVFFDVVRREKVLPPLHHPIEIAIYRNEASQGKHEHLTFEKQRQKGPGDVLFLAIDYERYGFIWGAKSSDSFLIGQDVIRYLEER
jgi:hypothetical protein